jgi:hypothetical protein
MSLHSTHLFYYPADALSTLCVLCVDGSYSVGYFKGGDKEAALKHIAAALFQYTYTTAH